jgi:hypothetical protein
MAEEWESWSSVLLCCRVMWFNLNSEEQNRSLFDRPLLMFPENFRCILQHTSLHPFYSSNQSLHKKMLGMKTTSALGWMTEGGRAWRGKTEGREGENLEALTHFSHRQNL